MTTRILRFGWLTSLATLVLLIARAPLQGLDYDCTMASPASDICSDCRHFVDHYRKCTGMAVPSVCALSTNEDGWVCTETTNDCPGKIETYSDSFCMMKTGSLNDDCDANYVTATANDEGDDPVCPVDP